MTEQPGAALNNVHDAFFKTVMARKSIAKDFFQTMLPEELKKSIDFDSLKMMPNNFASTNKNETHADVIYQVLINGQAGYLTFLVEHQSTADPLMPVRMLSYTNKIIEAHLHQSKAKTIPLVYPLVFYHGKKPYPYSQDIKDLVAAPRELTEQYFLKPFQLIDINQLETSQLKTSAWLNVILLTLKYIFSNLSMHLETIVTHFAKAYQEDSDADLSTVVIEYIINAGDSYQPEKFINQVEAKLPNPARGKLMTLAEYFTNKGYEQGMQQGVRKGLRKGEHACQFTIAKNLLKETGNIDLTCKVTGLTAEEVKVLIKKI